MALRHFAAGGVLERLIRQIVDCLRWACGALLGTIAIEPSL